MLRLTLGLIFVAYGLIGCPSNEEDPWTQVEVISDVVWSEEQLKIAYVFERYEQKTEGTAPYINVQTRNHRYAVYVSDPDGSNAVERLPLQPTRPLGGLRYYQGSDTLFLDDSREGRRVAWVHYADGESTKIAESDGRACDALVFRALPSPNGEFLALVRGDEDPACLQNATINARVSLVRTSDLQPVLGPLTLGFALSSPEMTWTPSGDFLMSDFETTYRLNTSEWDLGPQPGCFDPPTTSGSRGVDGRTVRVSDGRFIVEASDRAWSCQCEGPGESLYCR